MPPLPQAVRKALSKPAAIASRGACRPGVLRHPLDVILSCYFQFFREANVWSSTLENAATYFAMIDDHIEEILAFLRLA